MKINELRLKRMIRNIILENFRNRMDLNVGDYVLVHHTHGWEPGGSNQGEHAMDWGGLDGIVSAINSDGTCNIKCPDDELDELLNQPIDPKYLEKI